MTEIIYLTELKTNNIVIVKKIVAGHKAHRFLADLGIHEGEKIRIVKNDVGPIIVEVKGTRVAIGRGLAGKIQVTVKA
ncbi:MAG: ferrous iron transport protein A [Candidatus Thorarchaeota archaeon]